MGTFLDPISPNQLKVIWPKVLKFVVRGLRYSDGKLDANDVLQSCLCETMLLWAVYNDSEVTGCFVTQLSEYPKGRRVCILALSTSDFDGMMTHWPKFKKWAISNDADSIELLGRDGWLKKLPKYGFEPIHQVMRVKL